MKILVFLILVMSLSVQSNENFILVDCEGGKWEGNSIDSMEGKNTQFTDNGTSLLRTMYKIPFDVSKNKF